MPRNQAVPTNARRAQRSPRVSRQALTHNVEGYRHKEAKRVNNPPAALAAHEKTAREKPKQFYAYDSHLSP